MLHVFLTLTIGRYYKAETCIPIYRSLVIARHISYLSMSISWQVLRGCRWWDTGGRNLHSDIWRLWKHRGHTSKCFWYVDIICVTFIIAKKLLTKPQDLTWKTDRNLPFLHIFSCLSNTVLLLLPCRWACWNLVSRRRGRPRKLMDHQNQRLSMSGSECCVTEIMYK